MKKYVTYQLKNGRSHYLVVDTRSLRSFYGDFPVYETLCGYELWGSGNTCLPEDTPSRPICKRCLRQLEKTVAWEKLNLDFTPDAERLWRSIPLNKQELLLHNVWCSKCHDMTTITKCRGREKQGNLILTGVCATCGRKVARVIEVGNFLLPHPPSFTLRRNISTVRLEIDQDDLWIMLKLLLQHGRPDLVRRYLVQLRNEEFLDEDEVARLAKHYEIDPPRFW